MVDRNKNYKKVNVKMLFNVKDSLMKHPPVNLWVKNLIAKKQRG